MIIFAVLFLIAFCFFMWLEEYWKRKQPLKTCTWTHDVDYWTDHWETSCGGAFQFECGSPEDNQMKFCCYCGSHLVTNIIELTEDMVDEGE